MKNVKYCQAFFMGEPKEYDMPLDLAMKRFKGTYKWLKSHTGIAADGSFIGIKDENGKWIITNENRFKKKLRKVV